MWPLKRSKRANFINVQSNNVTLVTSQSFGSQGVATTGANANHKEDTGISPGVAMQVLHDQSCLQHYLCDPIIMMVIKILSQ